LTCNTKRQSAHRLLDSLQKPNPSWFDVADLPDEIPSLFDRRRPWPCCAGLVA
jgi:hypothetical protein